MSAPETRVTPLPGGGEGAVGAVVVLGAGIAGMQAALDCADAGFKVYLVERQPSIGGNMARLDKTFPTNDCAMCMISPKLVETGRHLDIEIISYADLEKVTGGPGRFVVKIRKKARYVDEKKCNGCGDCEKECPVPIPSDFNGALADRRAIYRLYPQAIPNVFTIDKRGLAPCRGTCPAGVNAQGYVGLIAKGKFLEALDLVRERMPFAGSCGRICHHPCEGRCNRAAVDEAVAVRSLKRFVADYERDRLLAGLPVDRAPSEIAPPARRSFPERVAVVGGGPAGMACAGDLARAGYPVTIFEAGAALGGMMRAGIPAYRLPRDILDHEIGLVVGEGVEVRTGAALGRDFTLDDLRRDGYAAVFVATGAPLAKRIPLEGSDARGVQYGIPFLREVNAGTAAPPGARVVVIGGGNVALDVARSALRLPGVEKVTAFCLESRDEMPAHEWERREAEEEGVAIEPSWGPARIVVEGGAVRGVELVRCTAVFDDERRFRPTFDEETRREEPADAVILAVGQSCDLSVLDPSVVTRGGVVAADRLTLETSRPCVFAGGDNVLGPSSLVQAVAQGHRGAESIRRFLRGEDLRRDREPADRPTVFADAPPRAAVEPAPRARPAAADAAGRVGSFAEIEGPLSEEEAVAEAKRCLGCGGCCECLECVRVCKAHAVDHAMKEGTVEVTAGAIVVTSGYDPFDPALKSEYAFGRAANVVTSIQFERILSASGPFQGHLRRPSDGRTPRRIAWIQCVGSRDVTLGNDYCSSVCCMYAAKEAVVAREHERSVEPTIFYTDLRAFGKGFDGFCNQARAEGVRFVRSQVSSLKENPENGDVVVRYAAEDPAAGIVEEEFDLVVLSVGLVAGRATRSAARLTGIDCDRYGFARGAPFEKERSSREGVYLSGAASGPKDIPETVAQSSAAAALCGELLGAARGTMVARRELPPEKDCAGADPRIGVFVCHCGTNIASVVDVDDVTAYAMRLGGVVHAQHTLYTCSQDTQERIKELVREKDLNRVIVASCTPRTHEPLFRQTLREAGLNEYLFEMVNIREQCSWVHQQDREGATAKARALLRGGVGKARLLEPIALGRVAVTKSALVLGGGVAGITAALSLARQGFGVELVEKEARLGGSPRRGRRGAEGRDWQRYVEERIGEVMSNRSIDVRLGAELETVGGSIGAFTVTLRGDPSPRTHGVIVVATGAAQWRPEGFLYGEDPRVVTQRDLETALEEGVPAGPVVMIQCVGSRCAEREYCSRVCCGEAVENAIAIKERTPAVPVHVLYRDMRTYGFGEERYRRARELGVVFVRFPDDRYPEVARSGDRLTVAVLDALIGEPLALDAGMVVLSAATVAPREGNRRLAEMLKVPLDRDGFFMEAHVKLRPVDFANAGIFVCGQAHSPKHTEENISQARAAAGRAACVLSRDFLTVGGAVARVDEDACASCLTCVRECAYSAPFVNARGKAEINEAKCQGCGNCAAACPAKAIQLSTFTDRQQRAIWAGALHEDAAT